MERIIGALAVVAALLATATMAQAFDPDDDDVSAQVYWRFSFGGKEDDRGVTMGFTVDQHRIAGYGNDRKQRYNGSLGEPGLFEVYFDQEGVPALSLGTLGQAAPAVPVDVVVTPQLRAKATVISLGIPDRYLQSGWPR